MREQAPMRILVVEDEGRLLELLRGGLSEEGHSVITSAEGNDALETARAGQFDAILLDVMLPGLDGFEIARRLRDEGNETPILMLTARDSESDIIRGLNFGADDYITKPFSFSELLARLRAVTRRSGSHRSATLTCDDLVLDSASHDVMRAGRRLHLTRTEFLLLQKLMQNVGRAVARKSLIDNVWGYDREIENNTLDAFIRLLRQKVDGPGQTPLIQTVRGFGYSVRADADSSGDLS
jgi:DNA-binding response OmpR family regulator